MLPQILQGRLTTALQAVFSSSSRINSYARYSTKSRDNGTWIQKLNDPQKVFLYGTRKNLRINVALYILNFRKPVDPEIIYKAIEYLQRAFPPYQCTVRERDGDFWIRGQEEVGTDVEVLPKGTSMIDVVNHMTRPFDEVNGPLSRYCFVMANEDDPCDIPEAKKTFPFQYHFYESYHHAISDGTSQRGFAAMLLDVLDTLIDGEDLPKPPTVGEIVTSEEYESNYLQIKEELKKNPLRLDYLKDHILKSNKSPILLKGFSRPEVDESTTKHIFIDIDHDVFKKFAAKCKENCVSMGNAFQTVTNSSLVEIVQDAGANDDSYDMSMMYSVDLRRYMKKRDLPILGYHARAVTSYVRFEKNVRDNFWDNCRMVTQVNKDLLTGNSVFEQEVIRRYFMPYVEPRDVFKSTIPVTRDFAFNNIGIIKTYGKNKHVMFTGAENIYQAHKFAYPFYSQILGFGGKMKMTVSYATDWLSDDTATLLAEKMRSLVEYHSQQ